MKGFALFVTVKKYSCLLSTPLEMTRAFYTHHSTLITHHFTFFTPEGKAGCEFYFAFKSCLKGFLQSIFWHYATGLQEILAYPEIGIFWVMLILKGRQVETHFLFSFGSPAPHRLTNSLCWYKHKPLGRGTDF
jgi:hypothetical protein